MPFSLASFTSSLKSPTPNQNALNLLSYLDSVNKEGHIHESWGWDLEIVLWKAQFNPLLRITELPQLTPFIYGILTQSIIMRRPRLCPLSGSSGLASAYMNLFPLLPSLDPRIVPDSAESTEGRRRPPPEWWLEGNQCFLNTESWLWLVLQSWFFFGRGEAVSE